MRNLNRKIRVLKEAKARGRKKKRDIEHKKFIRDIKRLKAKLQEMNTLNNELNNKLQKLELK